MLPATSVISEPRQVPSGTELKENIARSQTVPTLRLALTDTLQLIIVIAARTDNPMSLCWRCRTLCDGHDLESLLYGTRQGVSEWLMHKILEYAVGTGSPDTDTPPSQPQPHTDAEYRDIML